MEISVVLPLIIVVLSIIILAGKGDNLIAGYNTASKEEKQRVNIKRLRLVIGTMLLIIALAVSLPDLLGIENDSTVRTVIIVLILIITLAVLVISNTWCKKE